MYPYIHIILPSYTVMAIIGGFVAVCWMFIRMEKYQVQFTVFLKMFLLSFIGGFIGSKILFSITQIPWLIENFSIKNLLLLIPQSGLVFYGGLFGVIFTLMWLTRKDIELRRRVFSLATPAMPLFHAFGRVGCFLTGCCHGKELVSPIFVGPVKITHIPVQLIEASAELMLFFLLVLVEKKKDSVDLLKLYLVSYACVRFLDEFLRGDVVRGIYFGLSMAQWISMFILVFYLSKMLFGHMKLKKVTAI